MSLIQELLEKQKPIKSAQKTEKVISDKTVNVPAKKKRKKKVVESKKLNMTLMSAMLETTRLGDQPGMEHLKNRVVDADWQRKYMSLAAADRMDPDERAEYEALLHSRTKATPDPVKALEYKIHQLEAQKEHHQAHLNRANAKLQDPETNSKIKEMIGYLTIPEQTTAIKKCEDRLEKLHDELNNLKASTQF